MARLTPLGVFIKWVAVPAALALVGFYLIGPNIGKGALSKVKVPDKVTSMLTTKPAENPPAEATTGVPTEPTSTSTPTSSGPSVDVSVLPVSDPKPTRRRHKPKPTSANAPAPTTTPSGTPPPDQEPPPTSDPGGSGGATTAG